VCGVVIEGRALRGEQHDAIGPRRVTCSDPRDGLEERLGTENHPGTATKGASSTWRWAPPPARRSCRRTRAARAAGAGQDPVLQSPKNIPGRESTTSTFKTAPPAVLAEDERGSSLRFTTSVKISRAQWYENLPTNLVPDDQEVHPVRFHDVSTAPRGPRPHLRPRGHEAVHVVHPVREKRTSLLRRETQTPSPVRRAGVIDAREA